MTTDLDAIRERWAGVAWEHHTSSHGNWLTGQPSPYGTMVLDGDKAFLALIAHAPADIRALLDALAVSEAALTARSLTVAELLSELAGLRELKADVERWRDAGGDIRDLRYVLETLDKLPASAAERLVTDVGDRETLGEGGDADATNTES